jgi:SOS-response transcriptional repressor LexA
MNTQLTHIQQQTLDHIRSYVIDNGRTPTYGEIADHFSWAANNAYCHVDALVKKGAIIRDRGKSRGIRLADAGVVDLPDVSDGEYWFEGVFQHQRYQRDAVKAIQAAGMKVKGIA